MMMNQLMDMFRDWWNRMFPNMPMMM